jgi:uncharacterized membrane protein YgaE (UPF0421/DUF939 family)
MKTGDIFANILARWSAGWRDALASAVAATLSWVLAQQLSGHPRPVFAAVSAIICLSPGLPSHVNQAVGMMLGVTVGIVFGELALPFESFDSATVISVLTFFAMMAALTFGLAPVIAIQAGVSALLVMALGPALAGTTRLIDVAIGAAVGLVFSQILLTPDPVRIIKNATRNMLQLLAKGFARSVEALAQSDPQKAQAALNQFSAAHEALVAFNSVIATARSSARWSLRGRLAASEVSEMATWYERQALRLYASTLLFGEALTDALRKNDAPPDWLGNRVDRVAQICRTLADDSAGVDAVEYAVLPTWTAAATPSWRSCAEQLLAVEEALHVLERRFSGDLGVSSEFPPRNPDPRLL